MNEVNISFRIKLHKGTKAITKEFIFRHFKPKCMTDVSEKIGIMDGMFYANIITGVFYRNTLKTSLLSQHSFYLN